MICMDNLLLWLEISYSSHNPLTLVLIIPMSQIAYKETRGSYIGQNHDTLAYHNDTTDNCYVMQTAVCFNCPGDKCLSHAK